MGLFQKISKDPGKSSPGDTLPEYVDSLLDAADLDGMEESADSGLIHSAIGFDTGYGIGQVIELLQKLPGENMDLVVAVVMETLRSADIDVDAVVTDADQQAAHMQRHVADLTAEITALRAQIASKESDISQTRAKLEETLRVKDLLQTTSGPSPCTKVVPVYTAGQ